MRKIKVLFQGSCWPTNIGNAFVNFGAIHALKSALGDDGVVYHLGGMSDYLFSQRMKLRNSLPFHKIIDCDYFVHSGMFFSAEHFFAVPQLYQNIAKRGSKIIFLGCGSGQYTIQEVKIVRNALEKFPIYSLISRDTFTFEKYRDLANNSYNGFDCALFLGDCFQPLPLNLPKFDIMTFDHFLEPNIDHKGRHVIRTHHSCFPSFLKSSFFKHPYTLISDLPSDYLTLYANAKITYSDRVHACLPALAFGRLARLYFKERSRRIHIFNRIGVPEIYRKPVRLDLERFKKEKQKLINFLREILLEYTSSSSSYQSGKLKKPQIIPEISLYLHIHEKSPHIAELLNTIFNQIFSNFEISIIDSSASGWGKTIANQYKDYGLKYEHIKTKTSINSIISNAKGKFISFISPEIIYTPFFLYELRKSLVANEELALIYANYRQFDQMGSKKIVNMNIEFTKNNNIGYCFLVRKDAIGTPPSLILNIFQKEDFHLPLVGSYLVTHSPLVLGSRNIFNNRIGKILGILRMLIAIGRREGWRTVLKKGIEYIKRNPQGLGVDDTLLIYKILEAPWSQGN